MLTVRQGAWYPREDRNMHYPALHYVRINLSTKPTHMVQMEHVCAHLYIIMFFQKIEILIPRQSDEPHISFPLATQLQSAKSQTIYILHSLED